MQITTSNKPAKSHRDKSKQTNAAKTFISTTVLLETFIFATFIIAPMCIVRVKKIRNNTHSEMDKGKLLFDVFFSNRLKNLCTSKNDAYLRAFYSSGWTPVMSLYQHMLVFYAVMAAISFLSPGFFLTIRNASVS